MFPVTEGPLTECLLYEVLKKLVIWITHFQTGRVINASPSTAWLALGRTNVKLCLIPGEVGAILVIFFFKERQSVMISGRTVRSTLTRRCCWDVVCGSFETAIESRVTFRVPFRTSGQFFSGSNPFQLSEFRFLFGRRWKSNRFGFGQSVTIETQ